MRHKCCAKGSLTTSICSMSSEHFPRLRCSLDKRVITEHCIALHWTELWHFHEALVQLHFFPQSLCLHCKSIQDLILFSSTPFVTITAVCKPSLDWCRVSVMVISIMNSYKSRSGCCVPKDAECVLPHLIHPLSKQ